MDTQDKCVHTGHYPALPNFFSLKRPSSHVLKSILACMPATASTLPPMQFYYKAKVSERDGGKLYPDQLFVSGQLG